MADLAAPVRVAPLIKFSRWSLLGAGILYGMMKHSRYSSIENERRAQEARGKDERDAQLLAEKKLRADAEIKNLSEIVGGKV